MPMWTKGDSAMDAKSAYVGTIDHVTGPAPFIYRLRVITGPDEPPIMLYRYGDELRKAPYTVPRPPVR